MITEDYCDQMIEAIKETNTDYHERIFSFNPIHATDIVIGGCDEVPVPIMDDRIGTFHTHTLTVPRPSLLDAETFLKSDDSYMCMANPTTEEGTDWLIQCFDRDLNVIERKEVSI